MGKKSKPFYSKEKFETQRTFHSGSPARNLRKGELGAVIFGSKNHTKDECLKKNLFGLPAPHFSFVKNITPGLPIFLFNASDRMIHGVFEAITQGQMYIDSTAWTESEGAVMTHYPAQVRVKTVMKCSPLSEDKFKPAISRNYYTDRHFWFELDREQTKRLIELFSPSLLSLKATQPPNACLVEKKPDFGMQKKSFDDTVKNSASSMDGKNAIVLVSDPGFASSSFQTDKQLCPYKLDTEFDSHVSGFWEGDDQANNISESKNFWNGDSDSLGHSGFEPVGAGAYEEPPISTSGKASELELVIYELKDEIERFKVSDSYRSSRIENLENELENSKVEIGKLKKRLWKFDTDLTDRADLVYQRRSAM